MKRAIVSSLALAATMTAAAMILAPEAWAPPRAGANARTVLNDIAVCTNRGRFQVAYTPTADEAPNRILITANGATLVDRRIKLHKRAVTFPDLTLPDGSPDPFGGTRTMSRTFTLHWHKVAVGTTLQVTIFGVLEPPPPAGEVFPAPGTPDIVVANCHGKSHEARGPAFASPGHALSG